ncbi:hypothetical protein KFK09_019131 [Dendrobium nobile]|uniref:DUF4283 domain-containing protein n=1 Tax=Dendrobium nobile TaxID=94219 RepID=A0A8T3AWP6_DENNO|nr:hypothetical protein KFK09_019131 [Dendrobium nobile]
MCSLVAPFKFALVEKFPAHHPPLDYIRNFFLNLKLIGEFFVTLLNPKNILTILRNDLNYCQVFSHCSHFVSNCYMKLFKWSPHFDVNVESHVIPIWVSFPYLRLYLFSP